MNHELFDSLFCAYHFVRFVFTDWLMDILTVVHCIGSSSQLTVWFRKSRSAIIECVTLIVLSLWQSQKPKKVTCIVEPRRRFIWSALFSCKFLLSHIAKTELICIQYYLLKHTIKNKFKKSVTFLISIRLKMVWTLEPVSFQTGISIDSNSQKKNLMFSYLHVMDVKSFNLLQLLLCMHV